VKKVVCLTTPTEGLSFKKTNMTKNDRSGFIYGKKKRLFFESPIVICLAIPMLFLVNGCTATFEFTEPAGHPARTDISATEYRASKILLKASSVETKPARSTEWDDEEEMHHHENEH